MKKLILSLIVGLLFITGLDAQKYFTRNGHIWFYSEAPLENIEAHNRQANSIIDFTDGSMVFSLLMKSFEFEKALMQEHFNEKYVHSDEFPKAQFKGHIENISEVDINTDGTYPAKVAGELTIHGVTKAVETEGTIEIKDGKVSAKAVFPVAVDDYDIKIPDLVKDNIAKVVDVHVEMDYAKFEK